MGDWDWTDDQQQAIRTVGMNVLVSAAAGSGKTAVLAERCAHLVADAQPPCSIDQVLVVTFTDAAAAEMRQRIGQALQKRLDTAPTNRWLRQQLALIDTAWVSTIHAFCRRVLNRYFAQADLDPMAPIMDAHEAEILRTECARQVFDQFADRDDAAGEVFLDLLAAYGSSNEKSIVDRVLEVDAFLTSLPDPNAWLTDCRARCAPGPTGALSDVWFEQATDALRAELRQQLQVVEGYSAFLDRAPAGAAGVLAAPSGVRASIEQYADALHAWASALGASPSREAFDAVCQDQIRTFEFAKLKTGGRRKTAESLTTQDEAYIEGAKQERKRIRDDLFKKRLHDTYGRFSLKDWAEGIARSRPFLDVFLKLATDVREAYQSAKRDLGVVDFADLERLTLNLLRDADNGIAARLRDRFHHVLVDEFQDVNRVQADILRLVSRERQPDQTGNFFAVGDVKQSIYRFRLAEPQLFLERAGALRVHQKDDGCGPAESVICMRRNFRSRRGVLDAVNAVFERLMTAGFGGIDYDESARLESPPNGPPEGHERPSPPVELHVLARVATSGPDAEGANAAVAGADAEAGSDDDASDSQREGAAGDAFDWEQIEREAYVVADRIQTLVSERGFAYRDVVVLLRAMQAHAGLFVRALARRQVPVHADSSGGFFIALEVQDVLALLSLLDNEQQDIPLATVLRSPLLGDAMSDSELAEIRVAARRIGPHVPFHAAVRAYAQDGANPALRERLSGVRSQLRTWRARIRRRPLADVLWEIYEESGYLAYVAGLREGEQRQANLLRLHEYARQFSGFKRQGLYRFLRFIDGLREADRELEAPAAASAAANAVRVMTIHRSKGLEFPVVVLADLGKRFNLRDCQGSILFDRDLGVALEAADADRLIRYPTLPHLLVAQAAKTASLAEEMRVLYVALTRAKQQLILVGTGKLEDVQVNLDRYAAFNGPLPLLMRQTAGSLLDWVLPAVCCQPPQRLLLDNAGGNARAPGAEALFSVRTYDAAQMKRWTIDPPQHDSVTERLERLSRFDPIDDAETIEPIRLTGATEPTVLTGPTEATKAIETADRTKSTKPIEQIEPAEQTQPTTRTTTAIVIEDADRAMIARIQRRLTAAYPAERLTRVPAVAAASILKRRWETRQDDDEPAAPWAAAPWAISTGTAMPISQQTAPPKSPRQTGRRFAGQASCSAPDSRASDAQRPTDRRFRGPTFVSEADAADSTQRGTWTHEFLQRLDLARPCDEADLRDQLRTMTDAGVLEARQAHEVDPAAVAWLFSTELGRRLRSPGVRVLREWPFVLQVGPERYDRGAVAMSQEDFLLVRGIVDCMIGDESGWEIIDYKTDAVSPETIDARAAEYHGQLDIYAAAVEATWSRPVRRRWLVFLTPRRIVEGLSGSRDRS